MQYGPKTTADEVVHDANLEGKIALVTGGNSGIGAETVRALAHAGAKVYLCTRDPAKGELVALAIRQAEPRGQVVVMQLDLADLENVKRFAKEFLQTGDALHLLILNAGLHLVHAKTKQGLELIMGVNHVGHFLLTQELLPKMKLQDFPSRIIVLSSMAHEMNTRTFDATDLTWEKRRYNVHAAYAESKLANILFAKELARRLQGTEISVFAVHPGFITTSNFFHKAPWYMKLIVNYIVPRVIFNKTVQQGAATTVWAAVTPGLESQSGAYLQDCHVSKCAPHAANPELAQKLWRATEDLVAKVMPVDASTPETSSSTAVNAGTAAKVPEASTPETSSSTAADAGTAAKVPEVSTPETSSSTAADAGTAALVPEASTRTATEAPGTGAAGPATITSPVESS